MIDNKKVIPFVSVRDEWEFLSFETDSGVDVSVDWDTERTLAGGFEFNQLVKTSRKIRNHAEWGSWRHKCHGKAGELGVVELGFKSDKRQYRVLSMFHGKMRIIVLSICYHKEKTWNPKDAINIATNRAKLVLAGKAKLNVIKIANDL